jgi:hypothetical protein
MSYFELPYGIRSYCSGVWNATTQSFEKGDDVQCCLDSCKKHLKVCFDTCNNLKNNKNCLEECQDLVENCESVCLENSTKKSDLTFLKKINKPKPSHSKLFFIFLFLVILVLILIILKLKK